MMHSSPVNLGQAFLWWWMPSVPDLSSVVASDGSNEGKRSGWPYMSYFYGLKVPRTLLGLHMHEQALRLLLWSREFPNAEKFNDGWEFG
jgi:hypothetical protein